MWMVTAAMKLKDASFLEELHDSILKSKDITSRQIEREKVETLTDFIFLCSKISVDGDCS